MQDMLSGLNSNERAFSKWRQLEVLVMVLISVSPLLENSIRLPIVLVALLARIKDFSNISMPKRKYALYCILISSMAVSSLFDVRNATPSVPYSILNAYFPICITYGFVFSSFYKLDELLHYIGNIAFVAACFSLLGMFVIIFAPQVIPYLPNYTYGGYTHKTAIVFNVLFADGFLIIRNAGFAREPGIFQLLLNLGVLYESGKGGRFQLLKLIVLGLAIVLTQSTIGLIIYALIMLKVMKDVPEAKYIVAVVLIIFSSQLFDMVDYQLSNKLVGSDSFDARFDPMLRALSAGISNPLGLGNTGYASVYEASGVGSFDSFTQVLMRYGYVPFTIILVLYLGLANSNLFLFLAVFLTSLTQTIWFEPLFITLLFIPLSRGASNLRERLRIHNAVNVGEQS